MAFIVSTIIDHNHYLLKNYCVQEDYWNRRTTGPRGPKIIEPGKTVDHEDHWIRRTNWTMMTIRLGELLPQDDYWPDGPLEEDNIVQYDYFTWRTNDQRGAFHFLWFSWSNGRLGSMILLGQWSTCSSDPPGTIAIIIHISSRYSVFFLGPMVLLVQYPS